MLIGGRGGGGGGCWLISLPLVDLTVEVPKLYFPAAAFVPATIIHESVLCVCVINSRHWRICSNDGEAKKTKITLKPENMCQHPVLNRKHSMTAY